jgi:hypothetical protein
MANYYVRSGATGAANGTSWTDAYTTMATAVSGKAAGDVFYVSEDHAESTAASVTITMPGTLASPNLVYCVNHSGSVPPVSADLRTTGSIAVTGVSNLTFTGVGYYCYGLTFSINGSATLSQGTTALCNAVYESCSFQLLSATGGTMNIGGGAGCRIYWRNCTFKVSSVNSNMNPSSCVFEWYDTAGAAVIGPTYSTALIGNANSSTTVLRGLDLSGLGTNTIFAGTSGTQTLNLLNCKIGVGSAIWNPAATMARRVEIVRCDSGATNYRNERYWYNGTQTTETTIIRTGGATDGGTAISWKMVTTANSKWTQPFESMQMSIWNNAVGVSKTITIYGVWGSGVVPNNDDIWFELEYLGSASSTQGFLINTSKSDGLATGTPVSSDSSVWGGSTTPFKMSLSVTPQMAGPFNLIIKAAKPSTTFYIDPLIVVT